MAPGHQIYPYLLRHVKSECPNHIWGIDITYIRSREAACIWSRLSTGFHVFVAWELDQTLELPFILTAVDRAIASAHPTIWNSDQGSHFTSPQYLHRLLSTGVQISMDGRGRALDNIFHRTPQSFGEI
ncbi:MAG: hypothetical protein NTZ74_10410 [Chloroflexi bacterium]|nr:hypothetical protein [Chloroflexota bacterium]